MRRAMTVSPNLVRRAAHTTGNATGVQPITQLMTHNQVSRIVHAINHPLLVVWAHLTRVTPADLNPSTVTVNTAPASQCFISWATKWQKGCCVSLLVGYVQGALHGQSQVK